MEKHDYISEIRSFDDFRLEKEKLYLRRKLAEARIKMSAQQLKSHFSLSELIPSLIRETGLSKVLDLIESLRGSEK